MKLVMIFVDSHHAADVEALLEEAGLPGYSEFPTVLGKGQSGRKLGTRAFPGSSTLYLAAVQAERAEALVSELGQLRNARGPEEGLKVYAIDATEML